MLYCLGGIQMNRYNFWYKISFYYILGCTAFILIASMALIVMALASQYGLMEPFKGMEVIPWGLIIKGIFIELPAMLFPVAVPWLIYYLIHGKIRKPEKDKP